MKRILSTLVLAATMTTLSAQAGTFNSYTKPCPNTAAQLSITGVPKAGTTFTIGGIMFPGLCTRKFCGCNVGFCNDCRGSLLVLGVNKVNWPLPAAACNLHVSLDVIVAGDISGNVSITVPNKTSPGIKFYMQRVDLSTKEYIDPSCVTTYPIQAFTSLSDAVEGTTGL